MGVNKFIFGGEVKFDLTADTVTPQTLAQGVTAHNSKGEPITGTMTSQGGVSSGGGLIDVAELPTVNVDENAVYRVTETVCTENQIYIRLTEYDDEGNEAVYAMTFAEYLEAMEIPSDNIQIYAVDELPENMLSSDIDTFSELHLYIIRQDGICYMRLYDTVIARLGAVVLGKDGFDRGITNNIYTEKNDGIYTTVESQKVYTRLFVRENSEWSELTQEKVIEITENGKTYILSDDKKAMSQVIIDTEVVCAGDVIEGNSFDLTEDYFQKRDGSFCKNIKGYAFYNSKITSAVIPDSIDMINQNAFYNCSNLTSVTFKGKLSYISGDAFGQCPILTQINVPWSEGEIANAPWGANNATINYNFV